MSAVRSKYGSFRRSGSAWSARRCVRSAYKTPYSAVSRRKVRQSISESADKKKKPIELKRIEVTSRELAKKTWTSYSCSPLYQFKLDQKSLSRYARHLTTFLSIETKKNAAAFMNEDISDLTASLSIVKGLAVLKGEPDAVKIELRRSDDDKICAQIYLCSIDVSKNTHQFSVRVEKYHNRELLPRDFLVLPLLLSNGLVRLRNIVISWLQENFDCCVKQLKFSPIDLKWMASMWASVKFKEKAKASDPGVGFTWDIPVEGLGLEKIDCHIQSDTISEIWDSIEREDDSEITLENVELFMATIYRHLLHIFHIKFEALNLIGIHSPFVKVGNEGKLKISSSNYVLTVLAHLCAIAIERLGWKI